MSTDTKISKHYKIHYSELDIFSKSKVSKTCHEKVLKSIAENNKYEKQQYIQVSFVIIKR